jgi:hypothetical protein
VLHREYMAVVVELLSWGVLVRTTDDLDVLVDNTKVGDHGLVVGEKVRIIILDDDRRPMRGSCLTTDLETGRQLRGDSPKSGWLITDLYGSVGSWVG